MIINGRITESPHERLGPYFTQGQFADRLRTKSYLKEESDRENAAVWSEVLRRLRNWGSDERCQGLHFQEG